jgi:hypothetical protein
MRAKFRSPVATIWICALTSCTFLDHPTSSNLQKDLVERSKHGLALARRLVPGPQIEVRFFDGRKELIHPNCCPNTEYIDISRNHVVTVDMASTPLREPWRDPAGFVRSLPAYGGSVVAMDMRGRIVARSAAEFWLADVSLSPAEDEFALISTPRGPLNPANPGLYIVRFDNSQPRKIASMAPVSTQVPYSTWSMVDWSPAGDSIVLSHQDVISVFDLRTGRSHKVADGRAALWSTSSEWISYITLEWEHALLNVATGKSEPIDPGKKGGTPLEWSPDGKYLLVPEGSGSHVPFGCLWVYRLADHAWAPIPDNYGMAGPRPHWVQMEDR